MSKTILITGAGGILGKEFIRQLKEKNKVIALDDNEWAVAELTKEFPDVEVLLKDFEKWRFNQHPCDLVIHCAAYKHVEICEKNVHSAIENNLYKTGRLFADAYKGNAEILFISSDKAVEPIGVYGFTKALGERFCWQYNGIVARLGNILSSYGSVIPIWEKAIKEQKPIPITDVHMERYVSEAKDAVREILEGYEEGRRLIIPKAELVPINKLLASVLRKHGYEDPKDYKPGLNIIGKRPGEKLVEKLRWEEEIR